LEQINSHKNEEAEKQIEAGQKVGKALEKSIEAAKSIRSTATKTLKQKSKIHVKT